MWVSACGTANVNALDPVLMIQVKCYASVVVDSEEHVVHITSLP